MNPKRLLLVLTAAAIFVGVMADSAHATMSAAGEWYLGFAPGTTLVEGTSKAMTCSKESEALVLTGSIGETKIPVKIKATGIECIGFVIKNSGTHGIGEGKLKFTGVTVVEPTGCTVASGSVETAAVKPELWKDSENTALGFVKYSQPLGENLATVEITGACAAAGNRIVKGSVFGELFWLTGSSSAFQPVSFSTAIDTTAGSALKFAGNPAHLSGTVTNVLTSAEEFGAH